MAKTRAKKTEELDQIAGALANAKSVIFSDYQGMTVPKMTGLRKALSGAQVDYQVAKKTVLQLAAKKAGLAVDISALPGMIGVAISREDEMAGAKIIGDAGKDAPIKLVGGFFDGKAVDQTYVIALSKLPGRSQLLGQLLSVLNGPSAAFVRAMNAYRESKEPVATI